QSLLIVPTDIALPHDAEFAEEAAAIVGDVARALGGRTLVLFTSHATMREVGAQLAGLEDTGIAVLTQGVDGSRRSILERFSSGGPPGRRPDVPGVGAGSARATRAERRHRHHRRGALRPGMIGALRPEGRRLELADRYPDGLQYVMDPTRGVVDPVPFPRLPLGGRGIQPVRRSRERGGLSRCSHSSVTTKGKDSSSTPSSLPLSPLPSSSP